MSELRLDVLTEPLRTRETVTVLAGIAPPPKPKR
jgi:hypothetical protein